MGQSKLRSNCRVLISNWLTSQCGSPPNLANLLVRLWIRNDEGFRHRKALFKWRVHLIQQAVQKIEIFTRWWPTRSNLRRRERRFTQCAPLAPSVKDDASWICAKAYPRGLLATAEETSEKSGLVQLKSRERNRFWSQLVWPNINNTRVFLWRDGRVRQSSNGVRYGHCYPKAPTQPRLCFKIIRIQQEWHWSYFSNHRLEDQIFPTK